MISSPSACATQPATAICIVAALARGLVLGDAQPAEFGIDLFGGLLADMAGVEDDEVGVLSAGGLDKAFRRQRVHHALGIVDIHLAAI